MLESIKLLFDIPGCVFVLGIDRELVQRGIEIKYRDKINIRGSDYLEKIIQLPFTLPPIQRDTFRAFAHSITEQFGFDERSVDLIIEASDQNPRQIKRLANCLFLTWVVARNLAADERTSVFADGAQPDQEKLAVLLILQVRFPPIFRWLLYLGANLPEVRSDHEKYANELKQVLQEDYGGDEAARLTNEFFTFLGHAYDTLKIPPFETRDELQQYLRITRVVREPTQGSAPVTLDVRLDRQFVTEADDVEIGAPGNREPTPAGAEPQQVAVDLGRTQQIVVEWRALRGLSFWSIAVTNLERLSDRFLSCMRRVVDQGRELERQLNYVSYDQGRELREQLGLLREIDPIRIRRQFHAACLALWVVGLFAALAIVAAGLVITYLQASTTAATDVPPPLQAIISDLESPRGWVVAGLAVLLLVVALIRGFFVRAAGVRISQDVEEIQRARVKDDLDRRGMPPASEADLPR